MSEDGSICEDIVGASGALRAEALEASTKHAGIRIFDLEMEVSGRGAKEVLNPTCRLNPVAEDLALLWRTCSGRCES